MSTRSIHQRFWSDGWVRKLNALDRYVFLYFLTNSHSSWCGIYECPIDVISNETGIKENDLIEAIFPRLSPKVVYLDGWIYIKNWEKYHLTKNGTLTQDQKIGIGKAWKEVPEEIRLKIKDIDNKRGIPPPPPPPPHRLYLFPYLFLYLFPY